MAVPQTETASQTIPEVDIANTKAPADQTLQQSILFTAKGGSISFAGRIFEYVIRFGFSILVARAIGAEQYGLYTLGLAVVPIVSMLALLGLQTGVVAYLAPAIRQRDETRIWGIIQVCVGLPTVLSILFGILLFVLAEPVAILGFHEPQLIPILRIVSLDIPLEAMGFIAYQIIISYKKPKYSVLTNNLFLPLAKLLLTVVFLALGMEVLGVVTAHVIASALALALMIYYINKLFPLNRPLRAAKRNTRQLLQYSLPVHLGWVLNTVRGTLETLVLGFVGLTTGVGIFAVAGRLSTLGTMFFLAIGNISTPIIADFHNRGEIGLLKKLYQTTTKWLVMFNVPLFLFLVLFSKPLLSIFGSDFTYGAPALIVLAIGNLVYTGTGLGANILDMTNHTKVNSANSALLVIITITTDLLLIPRWGVIGAAAASAFSTVIVNVMCLIEVHLLLKMLPYELAILKPILAGMIAAAITILLNHYLVLPPILYLLVGGTVLWGVYALALTIFGFSEEEMLVITAFRARLKMLIPLMKSVLK